MDRYFMLRWLERSVGATVTGVVVDVFPRPIVVLDETLLEQVVPSLVGRFDGRPGSPEGRAREPAGGPPGAAAGGGT